MAEVCLPTVQHQHAQTAKQIQAILLAVLSFFSHRVAMHFGPIQQEQDTE
jgi:hypothetical protein